MAADRRKRSRDEFGHNLLASGLSGAVSITVLNPSGLPSRSMAGVVVGQAVRGDGAAGLRTANWQPRGLVARVDAAGAERERHGRDGVQ